MNEQILNRLKVITPEEQSILNGASDIDRNIFDPKSNIIDHRKILQDGKLIQVRKHARFVNYPPHKHNYIEMVYMYSGKTVHIINGQQIELNTGEILLLNPNAIHEIKAAGYDDIAVNFIILPEFFDIILHLLGMEKNIIWSFLSSCMKGKNNDTSYMVFRVSKILTIQNLMENLIINLLDNVSNKRSINQLSLGLVFATIMNYIDLIQTDQQENNELAFQVLKYIDSHYWNGSFDELAKSLNYDMSWLSRMIKKIFNKTYTDLVQEKRLNQSEFLLETTQLPVTEIGEMVGYSNVSYFYRIFKKQFGCSPKEYRRNNKIR